MTKTRRQPAKCGTDGGYYRHRRITNTEPCDACKRAHADWKRQRASNPFGRCPCGTALRTEGEYCSKCRRKLDRATASKRPTGNRLWRQSNYTDDEHDPKRPVAWRTKGAIKIPVYEQPEQEAA